MLPLRGDVQLVVAPEVVPGALRPHVVGLAVVHDARAPAPLVLPVEVVAHPEVVAHLVRDHLGVG